MQVKITTPNEKKVELVEGDYDAILKIFTPQTPQLVIISKQE